MKPKLSLSSNRSALMALAISISWSCKPPVAPATVLFSDDFNTDTSALWTVNVAPAGSAAQQSATFAFDYSAFGIPAAPGSSDTLGLRLRSNVPGSAAAPVTTRPAGALSGLSLSPTGKDFGVSYHLSFYAWANFNGAPNVSGLADNANSEGGTHNILFAVGTAGTVPLVVGNTGLATGASMDGIGFVTTGDGGITSDYRVYPASGTVSPAISGVYAAGTANDTSGFSPLNNVNLYYQGIPSLAQHSAPSVQQSLSTAEYGADAANTQAGQTQIGSFGFAWHKVDINKRGNTVTWTIDDVAIATANITGLALGVNNIAVGESDVNTTTTRHPSLLFTVIDNLVVTDNPRPLIKSSFSGGSLSLFWSQSLGGDFVLQFATSLAPSAPWSNVVATVATNSGTLSVTLPTTNTRSFFRLMLP